MRSAHEARTVPLRSGAGGDPSFEILRQLARRELQADVERAEGGVAGAPFVEAQVVDQLLEDQRVVGEQIDAPFPVVENDGPGDDLGALDGMIPACQALT